MFVLELLDDAREEENEHFLDMLCFEQHFGHVFEFRHERCDILNVVVDAPVLEAFDILVELELLSERGAESSQNRLVERIDLD